MDRAAGIGLCKYHLDIFSFKFSLRFSSLRQEAVELRGWAHGMVKFVNGAMFLQKVVTGRPGYSRWREVGDVYGADLRILHAVLAMHHGSLSHSLDLLSANNN